jgi:hypothetical protein
MKKIMTGLTLAVFALAPAMTWADCGGDHGQQASMASSKPVDNAQVQASASKSTHAVAKVSANKQTVAKKSTAPSKIERSTVVAKNN